ncbi:MAG: hypothetical protein KDC46_13145, partial [Thermoleophilia bacterium]|nr:hypothetical protein [Thermoleophilia bacterium]
ALEAALAEWPGTLILISHDRALIEGVATRCLVLKDEQLVTVVGGYDVVREVLSGEREAPPTDPAAALRARQAEQDEQRRADAAARRERRSTAKQQKQPKSAGEDASAGSSSSRTVKRRKTQRDGRPKVRRPGTIEAEIEQLDARKAEIDALMLDPDVYTDPVKSAEALEEHTRLERDLARRWEELERAVEHHGG